MATLVNDDPVPTGSSNDTNHLSTDPLPSSTTSTASISTKNSAQLTPRPNNNNATKDVESRPELVRQNSMPKRRPPPPPSASLRKIQEQQGEMATRLPPLPFTGGFEVEESPMEQRMARSATLPLSTRTKSSDESTTSNDSSTKRKSPRLNLHQDTKPIAAENRVPDIVVEDADNQQETLRRQIKADLERLCTIPEDEVVVDSRISNGETTTNHDAKKLKAKHKKKDRKKGSWIKTSRTPSSGSEIGTSGDDDSARIKRANTVIGKPPSVRKNKKKGGSHIGSKRSDDEKRSDKKGHKKKKKKAKDEGTISSRSVAGVSTREGRKKRQSRGDELPLLHRAVVDGDLDLVQRLLVGEKGNKEGESENTAHEQERPTKSQIAERLTQIDRFGTTPLHRACGLGVEIKSRDSIVDTIIEAIRQADVARVLSQAISKISVEREGKGGSRITSKKRLARFLPLGDPGETALHIAAKTGFTYALQAVLEAFKDELSRLRDSGGEESGTGSDIKSDSERARRNRSPTDPTRCPDLLDARGRTPAHHAAKNGRYECLVLLISNNGAVDAYDDDVLAPLDYALAGNHSECIMFLEKEGAAVDHFYQRYTENEVATWSQIDALSSIGSGTQLQTKKQIYKYFKGQTENVQNQEEPIRDRVPDEFGWLRQPGELKRPLGKLDKHAGDPRYEEKNLFQREKSWLKVLSEGEKYFARTIGTAPKKSTGSKRGAKQVTEENEGKPNKYRKKVVKLARQGIPLSVKGDVWIHLLEIEKWKNSSSTVYEPQTSGSKFVKQIDLDIARTHRDNLLFRERYSPKQCALFRILRAYSVHDKEVGYTQGMSDVLGTVLMFITNEEDAFWVLEVLMQEYGMRELFRPGFPALMEHFEVFLKLVNIHLPQVYAHLQRLDIHISTYATKWFLMLFSNLPFDTVMRVWDVILTEGYNISFAIALALLKMFQDELLPLNFEESIMLLQNAEGRNINSDQLIALAVHYNRKIKKRDYKLLIDLAHQYRVENGLAQQQKAEKRKRHHSLPSRIKPNAQK